MDQREKLLEQLTGVDSSKLNYYVELKKRNQEVLKQNGRLEILHQLSRDINIDMSIADIVERAFANLPQALPCDFLGLVAIKSSGLILKALMPRDFCRIDDFPAHSPSLKVIQEKKADIFNLPPEELSHILINPAYPGPLRSLAITPMFKRDEVIGALIVGSAKAECYDEADLSFVQHLTDQLSISIQNARLYKQVSRAKDEWESTFMAVTDPIMLIDTDYNVLLHNGRLPAEMQDFWNKALGRKCFAKLHGRTEPCPDCPIQEVQRSGQPVYQRWQTESGLVLDLSYYPVFTEDRLLSAVTIILKDVTEKIKMEGRLVQTAKLAALGEMAAGVAHELNSPMTVIIGTAQLVARELQEAGQPEQAEELDDIVNSGLRCKRIIQNLLTFSRQDQQPATEIDLNAEARLVLGMIKYQINRSQITITEHLTEDLPRLSANGPQIQQVLTNFLINARDALTEVERQEKTIEIATELQIKNGQRFAVLSVTDNGIGIQPENLAKIFTPFYTSKEATKGTGLGLSVSLGIAESHNGTIEVASTPDQGSTFALILPIDQA
ncbi:MAG: histidine kinase [Geobacteraceae bacterium GWC2_53_11]|nr:MAG: histidine kinase [Geobacteraceae bacterium GWC2_53_11]